jgi:predicted dehydrogenase
MTKRIHRRQFLATGLAFAAASSLPTILRFPRDEKLRLGVVGVGNRGAANLDGVSHEHIAALVDVDAHELERAGTRYQDARRYRDWREMLAAGKLDGVVISTPDHTHACIALAALEAKLPAYCEKPLTRTVAECRAVMAAAAASGVATQMGTQIHAGENYHAVVDLLRAGVLGRVSRVTAWVGTDWSATGVPAPAKVPAHLDYDLWLGPVAEIPFAAEYHPAAWRRYWHFGGGSLADMACHWLDLAWWALELRSPTLVSATGPLPDAAGAPAWIRAEWRMPSPQGEVTVVWHGASDRPRAMLEKRGIDDFANGILFEGERGSLVADYDRHRLLFAEHHKVEVDATKPKVPRSIGHYRAWTEAIRGRGTTECPFSYSGALTESVLLANIAFRTQRSLRYDATTGTILEDAAASALLGSTPRPGWFR